MSSGGGPQQIDITQLNPSQLSQLKKQLDTELEHLTNSFQSLRTAQAKFKDCLKSIEAVSAQKESPKPHLIPLTSSLYVPGHFSHLYTPPSSPETEKPNLEFTIDVGTGFYATYTPKQGQDFYNRKVEDLEKNLKDLESVVNTKAKSLRLVEDVMRAKVLEMQAKGQLQGGAEGAAGGAKQ